MIKQLDLQTITAAHHQEYMAAIERVVKSGWFLLGEETRLFEQEFAASVGKGHAVGIGNGLDALRLILRAYKEQGRLRDGDEVLVPANTYIATLLAITDNRLVPVLVEPTWEHLELDDRLLEQHLTPRTRAVMLVHLYGRNAYTEHIGAFCRQNSLLLLHDCAQCHGLKVPEGDALAYSFYPGKNMGAFGDAGAVATDDGELADLVRALGNYGSQRKYVFRYEGINSRMSEMDAAVLRVKLKHLAEDNRQRQRLAAYYYDNISNPLITLPLRLPDEECVYHQFPIFCECRDELQQHLQARGIQTLIHYPIPPHHQECYAHAAWNTPRLSLPVTERIHRQELSVPMSQVVTPNDADAVVAAVNAFGR